MDTQTDAEKVAANVAAAMRDKGYNNNSFARATGIARTTLIRHLEGNDPGFSIPQLAKVASVLEMKAEDFYRTPSEVSRG
jgi:DNA-binding phage protein